MIRNKSYLLHIIVLVILTWNTLNIARAPTPFCTSKPAYKQIPVTVGEIINSDVSSLFQGYNLNVTLANEQLPYAQVSRKWNILDRANAYYPYIISHFVQSKDNTVGRDSFLLYKDYGGTIWLNYGIIRQKDRLPAVNSSVIVSPASDKNVVCFDAALFLDHGLAIVDCARTGETFFSKYINYWYIVDLTGSTKNQMIKNDMYVNFKSITRRKLMKFSHPQAGGFTYLLRSYFADGVDKEASDNTYMQIFIVPVEQPRQIQPLRILDRTFLNVDTLRIMDAQIYNDDIFVLDYTTGLIRLDILESQRIQIMGRYRQYGFQKFGVYSDDLQDQCIIALANKHSVYEIQWHDVSSPRLINKYSLMENSTIKQVFLNQLFLIVQSTADAYNSTVPKFQIDYTWIFTKGSRTYLNAFHVINHNSSMVDLQFDRLNSHLYAADQKGLILRQLHLPKLIIHNLNDSMAGTSADLVILADSSDPNYKQSFRCQEKFTILFISPLNNSIFPTGLEPQLFYSVNYPKLLEIPLGIYFFGPNIQYQARDANNQTILGSWTNKINRTSFKITPQPPTSDITFFHTDAFMQYGQQVIIYYYQDTTNNTHIALCNHQWDAVSMNCQIQKTYSHTSRVKSFSSTLFRDSFDWYYFYIISFEENTKVLHIYDFRKQRLVADITYTGDFDAQITNVATSGKYLYVTRQLAKTIDVFQLDRCVQFSTCLPVFSIDAGVLRGMGIGYFAPVAVVTDRMHPEVMFIKCLDSLIIIDVDNKDKLHFLDQIISEATIVPNFQVALSKDRLVITAYPNYCSQYTLQHLYVMNMVTFVKDLSLRGMTLQPNADIQFSDFDGTVYINALKKINETKSISVVMIFRTGHAASNQYYALIQLDQVYSKPGFEVQVSGPYVNFLSIVAGKSFQVYRVFTQPSLVIKQSPQDFNFTIKAFNQVSTFLTDQIQVGVANQKSIITPTQDFNKTQLLLSSKGDFTFDDRKWFEGNVIRHNYTCPDCHKGPDSKVILRQHIDRMNDLHLGGNYYTETLFGGLAVWNDLLRFRPNGSIYQISNLPDQKILERCLRVAAADNQIFAVTACQEPGRGINLYVTSFASFKSFTWGPYLSSAFAARNLQIVNDILMLADTPSNPQYLFEPGQIFLYRLSFNAQSKDQMDELQIIDSNDFMACPGWTEDEAYLSNAHLVYSGTSNAYRLYITQARYGLFVVDFVKAHASDNQITILTTNFINLNKLLQDNKLHKPSDAVYLGVKFVKTVYNPAFDTQNIIVTIRGYDNIQVTLAYDENGRVAASILHRVYERYSFYNAVNEVHAKNGFILTGYILPPTADQSLYRKQYVTLYDSIDYPHQFDRGYSYRYIIGAVPLNTSTQANFAINTTYDFATNGSRSGIVIGLPTLDSTPRLLSASVSHNLSVSLSKGYSNQNIQIVAYNDFSQFNFTASLKAEPDQDNNTTIIIIVIVLCSIVFVFFLFYVISVVKRKRTPDQQRETLITDNDTIQRQSVQQDTGSYQPPSNTTLMRQEQGSSSQQQNQDLRKSVEETEEQPGTGKQQLVIVKQKFQPKKQQIITPKIQQPIQQQKEETIVQPLTIQQPKPQIKQPQPIEVQQRKVLIHKQAKVLPQQEPIVQPQPVVQNTQQIVPEQKTQVQPLPKNQE